MKNWIFACAVVAAIAGNGATVVDVTGIGAHDKKSVSISVAGAGADAYTKTLRRNLELTGCFKIENGGEIKVSGAIGGTNDSYSFKAKSKTWDAKFARWTKWVALAFVLLTFVLVLL